MENITVDTRLSNAVEAHNKTIQTLMLSAADLASDLADKLRGYSALTTLLDGFGQSALGDLATLDLARLLQQVTTNTKAVAEELQEVLDRARANAKDQGHLLEGIRVTARARAKQQTEPVEVA